MSVASGGVTMPSAAAVTQVADGVPRVRTDDGGPHEKTERFMPLFMDVRTIDGGVSVDDVAVAHAKDLSTKGAYNVEYQRYWADEMPGRSSVWSRHPTPRRRIPCTVRRTGSLADEIFAVSEHA